VQAENLIEAIAVGAQHSLAVGTLRSPQLTAFKILKHPDANRLHLFNLQIDGVTVRANVNSGSTGPETMSPGNHSVNERGGTGTSLSDFGTVIGGDAAYGSVSLAPGRFQDLYDHQLRSFRRLPFHGRSSATIGLLRGERQHGGLPAAELFFGLPEMWFAGRRVLT
jgi:hypothetical protein